MRFCKTMEEMDAVVEGSASATLGKAGAAGAISAVRLSAEVRIAADASLACSVMSAARTVCVKTRINPENFAAPAPSLLPGLAKTNVCSAVGGVALRCAAALRATATIDAAVTVMAPAVIAAAVAVPSPTAAARQIARRRSAASARVALERSDAGRRRGHARHDTHCVKGRLSVARMAAAAAAAQRPVLVAGRIPAG